MSVKLCGVCGEKKAAAMFHRRSKSIDGLAAKCRACASLYISAWQKGNRSKVAERNARWRSRHPDRLRASALRRLYGLTPEKYAEMVKEQDYKCALCGLDFGDQRICVDHDASREKDPTRGVRGLIHHCCNVGIGLLRHDPEILRSAAAYLERYSAYSEITTSTRED